jgi:hypothetical protein
MYPPAAVGGYIYESIRLQQWLRTLGVVDVIYDAAHHRWGYRTSGRVVFFFAISADVAATGMI